METLIKIAKLIALIALFMATSCKEDDPVTPVVPDKDPDPTFELAKISTNEITTFARTTATVTGKVTSDGGASIIEKGIVYGTASAPTIAGSKVLSTSGTSDLTVNITGLSLSTTYYARTYATNSVGTAYGNEVTFTTAGIDFYLAGGKENNAGYWKNNTYVALTTANIGSYVTAITAVDNDVYAAGYDGNYLVIWKNGVMTRLTNGATTNSAVEAIVVSGSDVYVAGWEIKPYGKSVAKYWKNGTEVSVSDGTNDAGVTSMFISGTDVYACGWEAMNNIGVAKYWKNGVPVNITNGTNHAYAASIFVDGADVYVAGHERNADLLMVAKYWKNGAATVLSDGMTHHTINDIFVKDHVVYTTGYNYSADLTKQEPLSWKNDEKTFLPVPDGSLIYGQGTRVFVSGSDVYVFGANEGKTVVWKNEEILKPYDGTFEASYTSDFFVADK